MGETLYRVVDTEQQKVLYEGYNLDVFTSIQSWMGDEKYISFMSCVPDWRIT